MTLILTILATWCALSILTAALWSILRGHQKRSAARAEAHWARSHHDQG